MKITISSINEVIKTVLNFLFFFTKRFCTYKKYKKNTRYKRHKKHQKHQKALKAQKHNQTKAQKRK